MRHVDHISPEAPNQAKQAIAQFLNEYTYEKNGPLKLHFEEEISERGEGQGHPAMRELSGASKPKARRKMSIAGGLSMATGGLVKDKQAQEQRDIEKSGSTLRKYVSTRTHPTTCYPGRFLRDCVRLQSVSGNQQGQAPTGGPPKSATARRGSVTAADMSQFAAGGGGAPPGAGAPRNFTGNPHHNLFLRGV